MNLAYSKRASSLADHLLNINRSHHVEKVLDAIATLSLNVVSPLLQTDHQVLLHGDEQASCGRKIFE